MKTSSRRTIVIVGGVAGGALCATRLRRVDESAEIIVLESGASASFANCGLPYHIGGVITLLLIACGFGAIPLSIAVVLHEGSTIVVVLNALRLLAWHEPAINA